MLMEEVLSNTIWASADAERISLLLNRLAMCGSAFTGAHRHHHLDHLIILVMPLKRASRRSSTWTWRSSRRRNGGSNHHSDRFN